MSKKTSRYEPRRDAYLQHVEHCKVCHTGLTSACWPENCHWYKAIDVICPVAKRLLKEIDEIF